MSLCTLVYSCVCVLVELCIYSCLCTLHVCCVLVQLSVHYVCDLWCATHSQESGRLLPCGAVDDWIHVNCALWSAEVYEDYPGLLYSVHTAVSRGLRLVSKTLLMSYNLLYITV